MTKPKQIELSENKIKEIGINAKHQAADQTALQLADVVGLLLYGIKEIGLYDRTQDQQHDGEKTSDAAENRNMDRLENAGVSV